MGKGPGKKEEQVMSKSIKEILNDIVEYYRVNPRGLQSPFLSEDSKYSGCSYAGCAVGFACGFSVDHWDDVEYGMSSSICDVHSEYCDENGDEGSEKFWGNFLPQYRYKNLIFWHEIQRLHDNREHWILNNEGGQNLSWLGDAAVDRILETFKHQLDSEDSLC